MADRRMDKRRVMLQALEHLQQAMPAPAPQALFGFDGYIDSLYAVVSGTDGQGKPTVFESSDAFLQCLGQLKGHSFERELQLKSRRAGGNAPLTAMAAGALGVRAHCMGFLGQEMDEFAPVRSLCQTTSLGSPAECMALEFADSKWMFSHCQALQAFGTHSLSQLPNDAFFAAIRQSQLIALLNWAALPGEVEVVQLLLHQPDMALEQKIFFVDFSDVSALSTERLSDILSTLKCLAQKAQLILSLNLHEAQSIARPSCVDPFDEDLLKQIQQETGAHEVVIHGLSSALCLHQAGCKRFEGFYATKPLLTTGGGDHFNGGYCAARLAGLLPNDRLALASATALYYITHGNSGTAAQIYQWLMNPQPDLWEGSYANLL